MILIEQELKNELKDKINNCIKLFINIKNSNELYIFFEKYINNIINLLNDHIILISNYDDNILKKKNDIKNLTQIEKEFFLNIQNYDKKLEIIKLLEDLLKDIKYICELEEFKNNYNKIHYNIFYKLRFFLFIDLKKILN